jgi:hypothetical protein
MFPRSHRVPTHFPNRKELSLRNKIERELDSEEIGKFAGSGGGLGAMDLYYLVEDETKARDEITAIINRHIPNAQFTIESEEFNGDESELDDEKFELSIPRLIVFVLQILAVLSVIGYAVWKLITWIF